MRLEQIETGLGPFKRLVLRVIGVIMGEEPPDILKLALYRSRFFAKPFEAINKKLLGGPSDWSEAEREMFAAFVSRQNQCAFCIGSHSALAAWALDDQSLVRAVLDDWRSAPVDAKVMATLGFLEKLNAHPDKITTTDINALRAAGVGDEAIGDVIYICSQFNLINRIVDALDLNIPSERTFTRFAAPSLPLAGLRRRRLAGRRVTPQH